MQTLASSNFMNQIELKSIKISYIRVCNDTADIFLKSSWLHSNKNFNCIFISFARECIKGIKTNNSFSHFVSDLTIKFFIILKLGQKENNHLIFWWYPSQYNMRSQQLIESSRYDHQVICLYGAKTWRNAMTISCYTALIFS
jgi:hypothetical protein